MTKFTQLLAIFSSFTALITFAPLTKADIANIIISNPQIQNAPLTAGTTSTIRFSLTARFRNIKNSTLKINVSLSELTLTATTSINGTIKNYFDIEIIDQVIIFTQNQGIPANSILTANIPIIAQKLSSVTIKPNGVNINVARAVFTSPVAIFTYVITKTFNDAMIISRDANGAQSVFAIDLDGDGDRDVLSASFDDDKIAWYENLDGNGAFGGEQIISRDADGAWSVFAIDLDGDGHVDILSASFDDDKIAWYKNNGSGGFSAEKIISTNADGARSIFAIDLDGDGNIDVLSASWRDDKIAWYKNNGTGTFGGEQIINHNARGANSVFAIDLDNDGDVDVLSASGDDNKIAWYKNNGSGAFSSEQVISRDARDARSVFVIDLDGDGDSDVLSASAGDDKIAWYKNNNNGTFGGEQIISRNADSARSVFAVDLDADGNVDVLSASFNDDKIAWYKNNGNGIFNGQRIISRMANGANSIFAIDLDGDGDKDLLSASANDNKIAWYKNHTTAITASPSLTSLAPQIYGNIFAFELVLANTSGFIQSCQAPDLPAGLAIKVSEGTCIISGIPSISNNQNIMIIATNIKGSSTITIRTTVVELSGSASLTLGGGTLTFNTNAFITLTYAFSGVAPGGFSILDNQLIVSSSVAAGVYPLNLLVNGTNAITLTVMINKISQTGFNVFGPETLISATTHAATANGGQSDGSITFSSSHPAVASIGTNTGIINANTPGTTTIIASKAGDMNYHAISTSYLLTVTRTFSDAIVISRNANGAYSVFAIDLDGDGDNDVLSASWNDDKIAWYKNNGNGTFGGQQIISRNADGAQSVFAIDLDGDGDNDVLSASWNDDKIAWYENRTNIITDPPSLTSPAPQIYGNLAIPPLIITNTGGPIQSCQAPDLPVGLVIKTNANSCVISGTLTSIPNTQNIMITATNIKGSSIATIRMTVVILSDGASLTIGGGTLTFSTNVLTTLTYAFNGVAPHGFSILDNQLIVNSSVAAGVYPLNIIINGTNVITLTVVINKFSQTNFKVSGLETLLLGIIHTATASGGQSNGAITFTSSHPDVANIGINSGIIRTRGLGSTRITASKIGNAVYGNISKSYLLTVVNTFSGEQIIISTNANGANSVFAIDLDGDGDNDVLSASFSDDKIAWYKNDGNGTFGGQQIISRNADFAYSVFAIDLDGDGDNDVLSASSLDDKIAWYKNDSNGTFGGQQVISRNANSANSVFAIDLDGDGDNDVLSASSLDDKIAWYENLDSTDTFSTQKIISRNASGAASVFAIDLDGDGDNDVLSASYPDDKIAWYENNGSPITSPNTHLPADATDTANALTDRFVPTIPLNSGGYADSWSIAPILTGTPSFNTRSGAIYGSIPTGAGAIPYTITAKNAGGTDTIILNISPRP